MEEWRESQDWRRAGRATDPEEAGWEPGTSQSEAEAASSSSLRTSSDKRLSGNKRITHTETFIPFIQSTLTCGRHDFPQLQRTSLLLLRRENDVLYFNIKCVIQSNCSLNTVCLFEDSQLIK